MIVDTLKNSKFYYGLNENIKIAFKFLETVDLSKLEVGRHEIDGRDVYAVVQAYDTAPIEDGKWEAHKKYIDIQYVDSGSELMGYANISDMNLLEEYNETKDILFLQGRGDFFHATSGMFALFTPEDAHMGGRSIDISNPIKKVLVKVAVD